MKRIMLAAAIVLLAPLSAFAISSPVAVTGSGAFTTTASSTGFTLNYTQPTDPAHALLLCTTFTSTATTTTVTDSQGGFVPLTFLENGNWNFQKYYGRMGVSGTTTNVTATVGYTGGTLSVNCGIFTGVYALPSIFYNNSTSTSITSYHPVNTPFSPYSLVVAAAYRSGTSVISAGTATALVAGVASSFQGLYQYTGDTSAGGAFGVTLTYAPAVPSGAYAGVAELLAIPDATTTPATTTPYVPQKQEYLFVFAVFLFIACVGFWLRLFHLEK